VERIAVEADAAGASHSTSGLRDACRTLPARYRTAPRVVVSLLVVLAACGGPEGTLTDGAATGIPIVESLEGFEPCSLPSHRVTGLVVELPLREQYPCQIVAVPTGMAFRSDPEGGYPDPSPGLSGSFRAVAKDSQGRYYTAAEAAAILAWNADGTLRAVVGRRGEGPGEFSDDVRAIYVDADDNIHVSDRSNRWLVFSEDLEFLREWPAPTSEPRSVHLIGDGRLLLTRPFPGAPDSVFHVIAEGEGLVSSHGTPRAGRARYLQLVPRPSALHDSGLWVAPARGTGEGYVLEHWSLDGRLDRLLQRVVPGLPLTGTPDEPMAPEFRVLHVDDEGILWVGVVVQDTNWRADAPGRERGDVRFEAVSPESGEVLAAVIYDTILSNDMPPLYPVQGTSRETIGVTRDELGLVTIRVYELHLVRNVE